MKGAVINITNRIVQVLINSGIITEESAPIYKYGLNTIFLSVIEVLSILMIACVVGNFLETTLFFLAFIPLRLFAGGWHASTRLRCYLTSLFVYAVFTFLLYIIPAQYYPRLLLWCGCFAFLVVAIWAPVAHKNHPITRIEYKHYKKISLTVCIIELMILIVLYHSNFQNVLLVAIVLGLLMEVLAMLTEKLLNVTNGSVSNLKKTCSLKFMSGVAACAYAASVLAANSACVLPFYQEEEPEELQNLKKFK